MILKDIWLDIKAVQERDPAARSSLEIYFLYPGAKAVRMPVSADVIPLPLRKNGNKCA